MRLTEPTLPFHCIQGIIYVMARGIYFFSYRKFNHTLINIARKGNDSLIVIIKGGRDDVCTVAQKERVMMYVNTSYDVTVEYI